MIRRPPRVPSRVAALAFAVALPLLARPGEAEALPKIGALRPDARAVDADDRLVELRALGGKPALVVYEDKDSSKLNQPLKDDLAKLARGGRYRTAVALVPVADVEGYDYWPVRGFVKDAIRKESQKIGATIYCDWDGTFRRLAGLRRGTSSIVLIGRDGRVRYAREGALGAEERAALLDLLKDEVEGPVAANP